MAKESGSESALVTLRIPQHVVDALDALTEGRLSRSQLVRAILEDFLTRDATEQQELIVRRLFGRSRDERDE